MGKIQVNIVNQSGDVLFSFSCKDNTLKKTIEHAALQGVNLQGADLRGANLQDVDFSEVKKNEKT